MTQKVTIPESELKHWQFAYTSAVAIIVILLVAAQLLIQASLMQETQARTYALAVGTQALRVQSLEQDVWNLLDKTQDAGQNVLSFKTGEIAWETVHKQINGFSLAPDQVQRLQALAPVFASLKSAYHTILSIEDDNPRPITAMNAADKTVFANAFKVIFYSTPPDLRGLVYINQSLNFQADTYVVQVRIIEASLFLLSLLTILSEWVFVIRPANKRLRQFTGGEQKKVTQEEEAE